MTELGLIFGIGVLGLAFATYLARWVLSQPAGDADMLRVASVIRRAAEGFLRRQTSTIAAVSAALGGVIFLAYGLLRRAGEGDAVSPLELGVWLTISFALGVAGTVLTGHVANWIATRTNVRTAAGARRSLDLALQLALRGGAVAGLVVVASGLLVMAALVAAILTYKGAFGPDPSQALKLVPSIPFMISGCGLGATFAALLAQLGGGTFSKAADLGADLGGQESGLPEDDARNPATIADLAGDAAGDCAARSSGLFASGVVESLAAMMMGAALYRDNASLPSALAVMLFPLVARAFGLFGTMFGIMVVKTDDREDPLSALGRGLYVTATLHLVGMAGVSKWLFGRYWLVFFGCGAIGVVGGIVLFHVTQLFTEHRHRSVRELAEAARAGPTLAILHGVASGLQSTVAPFATVVVVTLASYYLGARAGLVGSGLFGIAVATVGMLGLAGYVLSMDAFGPIVDGAGGIVEMTLARDRPDVRGRTLVLDGVGNTVKGLTTTYAAGTGALVSLLLVSAYLEEVEHRLPAAVPHPPSAIIHLDRPEVYVGAILGIVLVLWFGARCILGVTRTARRVVDEVRRQLRDRDPHLALSPEQVIDSYVAADAGGEKRRSSGVQLAPEARRPGGRGSISARIAATFGDRLEGAAASSAAYAAGALLGAVDDSRAVRIAEADLGSKSRPSDGRKGANGAAHRDRDAEGRTEGAAPFVPDHEACVELVTRAALRNMVVPALVAVAAPAALGLALRFAKTEDNPLVVANAVAALILAGTIAGVLGSLLLGIAGGAWDNAKKYIVTGAHGGRYVVDSSGGRADNPTYRAASVGDSFGDPLKDTLGPAMVVLVKMLPVVIIVFLPFFV